MVFDSESIEPISINSGEVIYQQGEPASELILVQYGRVTVTRKVDSPRKRQEFTLDLVNEGEYLGWEVFENRPYSTTAKALKNSVITRIPKDRIEDLLLSNPENAIDITLGMLARLRHRELYREPDMTGYHGKKSTAAALIEFVKDRHIRVSQETLALYAGIHRRSLGMNINNFEESGIVRQCHGYKDMEMLDLDRLKLIRADLL